MNKDALFTDETALFRTPENPVSGDTVTIRFRTAHEEDLAVFLISRDQQFLMTKSEENETFDYFTASLSVGKETISYYFRIEQNEDFVYYDRTGCVYNEHLVHGFKIIPGFFTPSWSKGAIMYQIFPDRFCNGNPASDPVSGEYRYMGQPIEHESDWNALPKTNDVGHFYGGDLVGVRNKLDYLQTLGVEVIYFTPLFVSPSNHKYDGQDYEHIDPHFTGFVHDCEELPPDAPENERYILRVTDPDNLEAANDYFIDLVKEIHNRGMRVILDGVFNHCGSFHKWMNKEGIYREEYGYAPGAYKNPDSPTHSYFRFNSENCDSYEKWWGFDTLPKLNYDESEELVEEMIKIACKWVSPPFCVDGWRLDVAADLGHSEAFNHRFWKRFRDAVKKANPDAVILAEFYGDPSPWLNGKEWDSVMNYDAFMDPVSYFLTGMEKHSDRRDDSLYGDGDAFFRSMRENMSKFPQESLFSAMNELSNHDHSRFLTRTNRTVGRLQTAGSKAAERNVRKGVFREAVVIQMTWPGAPTIYYGDEAGLAGWTDPDSRRSYPWGREDLELLEFHRYVTGYRKQLSCLRSGSFKELLAGTQLIAYGRFEQGSKAVIAVNNAEEARHISIPVWLIEVPDGGMMRILATSDNGYNVGQKWFPVKDGMLEFDIGPVSAVIFSLEEDI